MKKNFCTLFNSAYLSRGLVMYRSLEKECSDFHLYIIAFDDITYEYFRKYKEKHLTVISMREFEDPELLAIKPTRSAAEYCWTCSSSTILYCINNFGLDHCVYIDADMVFYNDPQLLFNEWGSRSVLITKHRYTKTYDQSKLNGIYCVQFVGFKKDEYGMEVLRWWRNACLEWCYDKPIDGKFGDQKYLDDWPERFKNVCDLEHPGGGVAPWNVQQYEFSVQEKIHGTEIASGKKFDLVFFHFHGLKFFTNNTVAFSGEYDLSNRVVKEIYGQYVNDLVKTGNELANKLPGINVNAVRTEPPFLPLSFKSKVKNKIEKIVGRNVTISNAQRNLYYLDDLL